MDLPPRGEPPNGDLPPSLQEPASGRPDYGIDSPNLVRNLALVGLVLGVVALTVTGASRSISFGIGVAYVVASGLMVLSSRFGKLRARDALLDRLRLAPDAQVLDVGCGRGLLLIGAAKRVPNGFAIGIDLWSETEQRDNRPEATLANAAAEGVTDRIDVHDGDMQQLPFADSSFDAVVSSLAIHGIADRDARRRAMDEIVRVLKPGGQAAIMDFAHVGSAAEELRAGGMSDVRLHGFSPWMFPPTRILTARK